MRALLTLRVMRTALSSGRSLLAASARRFGFSFDARTPSMRALLAVRVMRTALSSDRSLLAASARRFGFSFDAATHRTRFGLRLRRSWPP